MNVLQTGSRAIRRIIELSFVQNTPLTDELSALDPLAPGEAVKGVIMVS
jgi:hypothetical protein